jgi:hypothetical protein
MKCSTKYLQFVYHKVLTILQFTFPQNLYTECEIHGSSANDSCVLICFNICLCFGSNPEVFIFIICKKIHRPRNNDGIVITTNGAYSRLFLTKTFLLYTDKRLPSTDGNMHNEYNWIHSKYYKQTMQYQVIYYTISSNLFISRIL